jgi:hypothetical protein
MNDIKVVAVLKKFLLVACLASFCLSATAKEITAIDLAEDWGIEPVHIRVTAGGYMIEFRYKILDTQKALIMSDRQYYPHLQSLKSRARLSVTYGPTVGVLKSNRKFIKEGKHYSAIFSNEGQHLLPGDKVKIEIKDQSSPVLTLQ